MVTFEQKYESFILPWLRMAAKEPVNWTISYTWRFVGFWATMLNRSKIVSSRANLFVFAESQLRSFVKSASASKMGGVKWVLFMALPDSL